MCDKGKISKFFDIIQSMNNSYENFIDPAELSSKQEKIKEQFLRPFTEEEIAAGWDRVKQHVQDNRAYTTDLMHRKIDGAQYSTWYLEVADFRTIEFQLANDLHEKVAELVFEENIDHPGIWKLMHRSVHTKDLGINGTEFLQKAEEYIQLVAQDHTIIAEQFTASASQEKVINWLLKNGYDFDSEDDKKAYEHYLNNPEEYEFFKVIDGSEHEDFDRELVIFKSSEIDQAELQNYRNANKPELLDGDMSLLKVKGLLRVHLKKDLI